MEILLQIVLILVNAFFAGTEMAVVSLNATKLRKLQEEGDKTAGKLLKMVEDSSAFLSTIQVAITLAGYLGAAFAGENFAPVLSNWLYNDLGFQAIPLGALNNVAIIIITIILSYFTLVFGELVPKRIALQKSYEFAKVACGVIRVMATVLRPVIWLLSISVNGVLRLLRLKVEAEEENVTEDEIRMMVDLGGEKGAIDEDEQEWIQNVFDFGDTTVRESMTPRGDLDALDIESTEEEIMEMIQQSGRSRLPVYEENADTILGILNARDYLLDRSAGKKTPLKELLRPASRPTTFLKRRKRKKCTSPLWWTNTAAPRASSPWKTCWRRSWATSTMSSTSRNSRKWWPWAKTSGGSPAPRLSAPWWTTWSCPCRKAMTTTPWAA